MKVEIWIAVLISVCVLDSIQGSLTEQNKQRLLRQLLTRESALKTAQDQQLVNELAIKRTGEASKFNSCPQEEPFPCKMSKQCISLKHVCDGNQDCSDGWDEQESVCLAYHRVPVEDLEKFIMQQSRWMLKAFFSGVVKSRDDLVNIAHKLSVSRTIDDFQQRLHMSPSSTRAFEDALKAVRSGDIAVLEDLGMSPDSWGSVRYVFSNLIESGFLG